MAPAASSDGAVVAFPDCVYSRVGGADRLADVFLPASGGPFPVIVYLHGGAWRTGDRRFAPDLRRFFAASGFAMVSIDYRLSNEATFPAAVEDVAAAVRWVRREAARFGFDPARIGLWGVSAGGHLAAMAALAGERFVTAEWGDQSSAVAAAVDAYGPTDFREIDPHTDPLNPPSSDAEAVPPRRLRPASGPNSFESLFIGAPVCDRPDLVARADPATYAGPGACPLLLVHGSADTVIPVHQSELLYGALSRHGNDVELAIVDGLGHGFFNRNHLDDAGPRLCRHRRSIAGRERRWEAPAAVFDLVRSFFTDRMRPS